MFRTWLKKDGIINKLNSLTNYPAGANFEKNYGHCDYRGFNLNFYFRIAECKSEYF